MSGGECDDGQASVRAGIEILDRVANSAADSHDVLLAVNTEDKYALVGQVEIDCASRLPLCRAACCRLRFALSAQDVREKFVRWDPQAPYLNAQRADHYCVHVSAALACSVYAQRPVACRAFDCRADKRIWLDFHNAIVNPAVQEPGWPILDEDTTTANKE